MSNLRVGIVGLGWGVITHVPAFRAARGYDVVALCGRRSDAAAEAAAATGITDTSTDWRSFVARDDLDVIAVATPVASHADIGLAAVAAHKHLVMEKPVALEVVDAERLADAVERAGVVSAVCFEQRWTAHRHAVWELAREGFLGETYCVRQITSAPYSHPSRAPQAPWMYRVAEGGGFLRGTMSHDIDFVRAAFSDFESVVADVVTSIPHRAGIDGTVIDVDADDTTSILARLASGAHALLSTSTVGAHTRTTVLEAFGSEGTIIMRTGDDGPQVFAGAADGRGLQPVVLKTLRPEFPAEIPERRATPLITALAVMLEKLLPAFSGEPVPVPSVRDSLHVDRVIYAARRSSDARRWVPVAGG